MKLDSNNYLTIFIAVVLIVSIAFNVVVLKAIKNNKTNNVNTTIIKPIERILTVHQNTVFQKMPVTRPEVVSSNGDSMEKILLERLESATPSIKTEDVVIKQYEDGSVETSPTISGTMNLDYLQYSFRTSVKLDVLKISDQNNIHALSILKFKNNQLNTDVGIGTTFEFWNENITLGIEPSGISAGVGRRLTKNSALSLGMQYSWDGMMSPYAGLSFRL
jgi:hypothetical protein